MTDPADAWTSIGRGYGRRMAPSTLQERKRKQRAGDEGLTKLQPLKVDSRKAKVIRPDERRCEVWTKFGAQCKITKGVDKTVVSSRDGAMDELALCADHRRLARTNGVLDERGWRWVSQPAEPFRSDDASGSPRRSPGKAMSRRVPAPAGAPGRTPPGGHHGGGQPSGKKRL